MGGKSGNKKSATASKKTKNTRMSEKKEKDISVRENGRSAQVPGNTITGTSSAENSLRPPESRNWCFTMFNKTSQECINSLGDFTNFYNFIIEKAPSTDKLHCQGFFQLKRKNNINFLKKKICKSAHFEIMRASYDDNMRYTSKLDTIVEGPFTSGKFIQRGERTDLGKIFEEIKSNGLSDNIVFSETYLKYSNSIDKMAAKAKKNKANVHNKEKFENFTLYEHQKALESLILAQDDRKILWVYDPLGSIGKTTLCLYMQTKHNAFLCSNGSTKDIFTAYDYQDIVCFNFVRSEDIVINYTVIENLKDGIIFKQKYDSAIITRAPVKVAIFSNFPPSLEKLSSDRWTYISFEDNIMKLVKVENDTPKDRSKIKISLELQNEVYKSNEIIKSKHEKEKRRILEIIESKFDKMMADVPADVLADVHADVHAGNKYVHLPLPNEKANKNSSENNIQDSNIHLEVELESNNDQNDHYDIMFDENDDEFIPDDNIEDKIASIVDDDLDERLRDFNLSFD